MTCPKCGQYISTEWHECLALALAAHKTQDTDCTNATVLTKGEK